MFSLSITGRCGAIEVIADLGGELLFSCDNPHSPITVLIMETPESITFIIEPDEIEGFTASWDEPGAGGGICTEGDSLVDLQANILDAVRCHFGANQPRKVLLRFATDVALVPA